MKIETVYVEITNLCNLNCRTCYNRSGLNRITKEISPNQLEYIYLRFQPYGMKRLLISGGEPSLHSKFHEILALADKYPDLTLGIVTNGTNHDPVLINALNSKPNMTLQISLDGASEEINQKTRGTGNFEKALGFAKQIRMNNIPRLKMVISKYNLEDVEPFYRLAHSLEFQPEYAFIYRSGNACDDWEEKLLSANDKIHVLKLVDSLNKELGGDAFLPRCTSKCPFTGDSHTFSLSIQVDGTIQPCQMLHDTQYSVGNVFYADNDALFAALENTERMAKKRMSIDYGCTRCFLKDTCGHGCMGAASVFAGDPLGDDGECSYRKSVFLGFDLNKIK